MKTKKRKEEERFYYNEIKRHDFCQSNHLLNQIVSMKMKNH